MNKPLNWHPMAANPLDYLSPHTDRKLVSADGQPVKIEQSGNDFVVTIGATRTITGSNLNTCYHLNQHEVALAPEGAEQSAAWRRRKAIAQEIADEIARRKGQQPAEPLAAAGEQAGGGEL